MPSVSAHNETVMVSKMDPQLVHRVLLTDKAQFPCLTMSGRPSPQTPSFDEYYSGMSSSQQDSRSQNVDMTMKRAFKDHICSFVLETRNMEPLTKLVLDLHSMLRRLVPNRKDLHGILKDEVVLQATSPASILPLLLEAGLALEQLESPARSETTQEWIATGRQFNASIDAKEALEFIVTSTMYLLFKAELCETDKQDFYLANVWAPDIHLHGKKVELSNFEARYGALSDISTAPLTKEWIKSLVERQSLPEKQKLLLSAETRMNLIRVGWVEDVLFREAERSSLVLPEVLALDSANVQQIRQITRIAASGSALALHACSAAKANAAILSEPLTPSSPLETRRDFLVQTMTERKNLQSEFEEAVSNAVITLAVEWDPSLSEDRRENLRSQTVRVLSGEDPVIKLLDSRMKEVFKYLIVWKEASAPTKLRSGRGPAPRQTEKGASAFQRQAKSEFCKRGLSFYSSDLVKAAESAVKIIDLALENFGTPFMDKIVVNACAENPSDAQ